jgi:hypothetical protein
VITDCMSAAVEPATQVIIQLDRRMTFMLAALAGNGGMSPCIQSLSGRSTSTHLCCGWPGACAEHPLCLLLQSSHPTTTQPVITPRQAHKQGCWGLEQGPMAPSMEVLLCCPFYHLLALGLFGSWAEQ